MDSINMDSIENLRFNNVKHPDTNDSKFETSLCYF